MDADPQTKSSREIPGAQPSPTTPENGRMSPRGHPRAGKAYGGPSAGRSDAMRLGPCPPPLDQRAQGKIKIFGKGVYILTHVCYSIDKQEGNGSAS